MKQIHVAKHAPEAHLVKGFLESNGIAAEVRGEFLTSGWASCRSTCAVCGLRRCALDRAVALVAFLNGTLARAFRARLALPWLREQLEGRSPKCWNCGAMKRDG